MKIAVLVKQVPDTNSPRHLDSATGRVNRASGQQVIDEIDERAVEAALKLKESATDSASITVITMGPEGAKDAVRKALAMGADAAVHIADDALAGSDVVQTSAVLAAAVKRGDFDLVIAGNEATDGRTAAVPAMLAERLGWPQLTFLRTLTFDANVVEGERLTESGSVELRSPLPAVVSVTEQIGQARYPNFKGIMAAKKKPLEALTINDLGIEPAEVGAQSAWTVVRGVEPRPAKEKGEIVTDDGTGGRQVAEFLTKNSLI